MNNQQDLFYDTPPLSPILFDDLEYDLDDNLLSPILYQGDLGDEVPILEFNLDDDIDLSDLEFDENLADDLGVFTPPSSPKTVFYVPKPVSDIFDFFFYR